MALLHNTYGEGFAGGRTFGLGTRSASAAFGVGLLSAASISWSRSDFPDGALLSVVSALPGACSAASTLSKNLLTASAVTLSGEALGVFFCSSPKKTAATASGFGGSAVGDVGKGASAYHTQEQHESKQNEANGSKAAGLQVTAKVPPTVGTASIDNQSYTCTISHGAKSMKIQI